MIQLQLSYTQNGLKKTLSESQKAYLAGFLDGDGCINAQLVSRPEYRLKFQIRLSITFFQSTKRYWFLCQWHKLLGCGVLRKRNDGISEYSIVGTANVARICTLLLPYLCLKRRQAELVLQILAKLSRTQDKEEFIALCELADSIGALNDSKKRTITAAVVRQKLEILFPVETSDGG